MAQLDLPIPLAGRQVTAEQRAYRHLDLSLALAATGLACYGLMMVYSSTHRTLQEFGGDPGYFLKRQATFLVIGVVAMVVATLVDYRLVRTYAPFFYLLAVTLLVLVRTPLGSSALGAQRWFQVGGFQFSPSLFGRLALVVMLAAYLSSIKGEVTLRHVVRACTLAAVCIILVFLQPDIGTSIILAAILVGQVVVSGTRARYLAVLALAALIAIFGAFRLGVVKDYQISRLTSFLQSDKNLQSANYNKQQAEIAIGAGGLTGRGYLKGSQTNLDFVPEQHTDFIFTVVGEELGFFGALLLLLLFGLVLWRAYRTAALSKDPFGTFLAVGVGTMFAVQMFVNIGMNVGIMPITGIPLPFVSYGGSALIADFIGVGLLLNVQMRRFQ
jgi:rod shape determining protein RodA